MFAKIINFSVIYYSLSGSMNNKFLTSFVISLVFLTSISFAQTFEAFAKIVGVDSQGRGIVGNISVEIQPGKGRVLVDTTPLQGIYTQDSERVAVKVASDITGFGFSDYDVIYNIVTMSANSVEGPSAGGAMTLATIAAIQDKHLSSYFSMTGTINEDHTIGKVGGILAKVKAAADNGITLFLIPKGESIQYQYVRQIKTPSPGWRVETVEPVEVNVTEMAKEWGLDVYEVSRIEEAVKYAFELNPLPGNMTKKKLSTLESIPSFTNPVPDYKAFANVVDDEVLRAQKIYRETRKKASETILPDDVRTALDELLKQSEAYLVETNKIFNRGYTYSAGNNAFKSIITSETVSGLVDYHKLPQEGRQSFLQQELDSVHTKVNETIAAYVNEKLPICDSKQFEWVVASRQRLIYAKQRLNETSSQAVSNAFSILFDINTVGEWLEISKSFKSRLSNGNNECEIKFKGMADQKIAEALNEINNLKELGVKDYNDAGFYIDTAKQAYDLGWYINSIYDATNAKSRASTSARYDGKSFKEIYSDFNSTVVTTSGLISTILYENAQYTMYLSIKENNEFSTFDALTLLKVSQDIENATISIYEKLPKERVKISLPSIQNTTTLILILTFASTGILMVIFVLYAISVKRDIRELEERYLTLLEKLRKKSVQKVVGNKRKKR